MLSDIEKTFDTAFFLADQQVKNASTMVNDSSRFTTTTSTFDDIPRGFANDDEGDNDANDNGDSGGALIGALNTIAAQLSTMAFCFAQLMCKTILYSENYFILKDQLQQLQIENFNLKSDKLFMEFVRKLNLICREPKTKTTTTMTTTTGNIAANATNRTPTCRTRNVSPKRKFVRSISSKQSKNILSSKSNRKSSRLPGSCVRIEQALFESTPNCSIETCETKLVEEEEEEEEVEVEEKEEVIDDHLLHNGNRRDYLPRYSGGKFRSSRFGLNRCAAFRALYRGFNETELIAELNLRNLALQRETIAAKADLVHHRHVIRFLNNQISGRIQQIQLLTRDRRDTNFDNIWSDLESEIKLNRCKTVVQVLALKPNVGPAMAPLCDDANLQHLLIGTGDAMKQMSTPTMTPVAVVGDDQNNNNNNNLDQASNDIVNEATDSNTTTTSSSIDFSATDNDNNNNLENQKSNINFPNESVMKLANFKRSWFNMGLLRFVFVELRHEAIGISIIGGKEYDLPIIVSQIHEGTPAERVAAIRPGDIILTVNFADMTNVTHDHAVTLLSGLTGTARLGVIYFKSDETLRAKEQNVFFRSLSSSSDHHHHHPHQPDDQFRRAISQSSFSPLHLNNPSNNHHRSSTYVSLHDMSRLLPQYYRSVFNTFLSAPLYDHDDHASSSSSSSSFSFSPSPSRSDKQIIQSVTSDDDFSNTQVNEDEQNRNSSSKSSNFDNSYRLSQDTSIITRCNFESSTLSSSKCANSSSQVEIKRENSRSIVLAFPGCATRLASSSSR